MATDAERQNEPVPTPSSFLVVGLGASAGGVEALREFFAHVPAESGNAYVVILHLSPEHESQLAAVIQAVTPIPVMPVVERVRVEPNHIYVISPNNHLAMADGELVVSPNTLLEERRAPIDIFFRTLAETHQARAACVVLSGTGADGSMGLKRVKERGGAVFVQSPREAAFSEMPRSAIATELVDEVLSAADIPARIMAYRARLDMLSIPVESELRPEEQQQALREVFTQLRVRTGHDFSNYKRPTLLRRIERRINVRSLPNLSAYAAFLHADPDEVQALLKNLLISVTNFFRDKEAFATLEQEILPRIFEGRRAGEQVRIWVLGCATGEEAYSIAMLCAEYALSVLDAPSIQIFATDIDDSSIAHARAGRYTAADVADVSPERLRRFFTPEDQHYRVRREIRDMVLFANHNVLKDPPFSHLDLVSCRNLLIYLNHTAQERVMETLHFALNPGGFLFLGASESVDGSSDLFATVNRDQRIFQSRQAEIRPLPSVDVLPLLPIERARAVAPQANVAEHVPERPSYGGLHQWLLEQYAPPSLVVNQDYDILHLSAHVGRYLQIAGGEISRNIFELIRPELRQELRTALFQAIQRQTNVDTRDLPIRIDKQAELVTIHVRPVLGHNSPARGLLLVLFEPGARPPSDAEPTIHSDEPVTQQLEDEAQRLRQQLRLSGEQYEVQAEELRASNEELQALNEELRSSTEELETSKEELQSINEELRTVNQELKVKVEEATQTSTNLQNLVNSTDIGTIFLDRGLRVKLFIPAARELFNLIPADYGRPLADITHRLADIDVLGEAQNVLEKLQAIEREVRTNNGGMYLLRVLPYRVGEDRIGGVVITFVDITARKRAEDQQAYVLRLSDALRPLRDPVDIQEAVTRVAMQYFNADRCYYCEIEQDKAIIRRDSARGGLPSVVGEYPLSDMPIFKAVVDAGRPFIVQDAHTTELIDKQLRDLCIQLQIISFINVPVIKDGQAAGILCITQSVPREWTTFDVEMAAETAERSWVAVERAHAEQAVRESEAKYRTLFDSIGEGFCIIEMIRDDAGASVDYRFLEVNRVFERQTGLKSVVGKRGSELMPGTETYWIEQYDRVARTGEPLRVENYHEATGRWYLAYASRAYGTSDQVAIVFDDITERKRREAALAFLAEVSADFAPRLSEGELMGRVAERLARFLGLSRCDFSVVALAADRITTLYDWRCDDTLPSVLGEHQISTFLSEAGRRQYQAGQITVIEDTFTSPLLSDQREIFQQLGIGAVVDVPYLENGRWKFLLSACRGQPSAWRADEVELIRELTARLYIRLERARAEDALLDSEQRLRALIENLPGGAAFIVDRDLRYVLAEGEALAIAGFKPEDLVGKTIFETLEPDSVAEYELNYRRGLAGKSFQYEHDAHGFSYISRGTPLYAAGEVYAVLVVSYDITERKRAEAALRTSEESFRTLADVVPQVIWTNTVDGEATYFNQRWYDYSGLSYHQSAGPGWQAIVHPDDAPASVERWRQALAAGQVFETEYRLRRADGVYRWHLGRNVPLRDADGQITGWFGSATDIEDMKGAEAARRESDERFRLLVDGARDFAMFLLDPDNRITFWSIGAERVFGWAESEVLGQSGGLIFTPEDRERGEVEREIASALRDGRAEDRRWHLKKDGTRLFVDGALIRLDGDGHPRGFVKIGRDATAQREASEEVRRARDELEQRVAERTEALSSANARLQTEIAARAQLEQHRQDLLRQLVTAQEDERRRIARELHDELGQEITGILLQLKLLQQSVPPDEALTVQIQNITDMTQRLASEAHQLAVELRPTALDDVGLAAALRHYVALWSERTQLAADLQLDGLDERRLPPEVETVVYRVVQEALTNVAKHALAQRVGIILLVHGGAVQLIVEDDGQGFDSEAPVAAGSLGIASMRERVEQVNGNFSIESAPGAGTTLYARMPLPPAA
jgi:two-component system CheB/CheR fusion protein